MPKITPIGKSNGVVLSSNTLQAANLQPGDQVVMSPIQDGVVVAARNSATGAMVEAAEASFKTFAETYRILAR